MASARTIATRCCWPPESRSGYSSRLSASPNRSRSAVACASASRRDCPSALRGASVTFSSTVMWGKRLNDWKTIPIRRRTSSMSTLRAVISTSPTTIVPASIGSSRLMQRRSVDLPEPEAPIRQTTSCSPTTRSIPRSTSSLSNDLRSPSTRSARDGAAGRRASLMPASRPSASCDRARSASP